MLDSERDIFASLREEQSGADFLDSTIVFSINNDSESNMDYYIFSCLSDTCISQNSTDVTGVITISYSSGDCVDSPTLHTVSIYGVNRCGVRSKEITISVYTNVNSGNPSGNII